MPRGLPDYYNPDTLVSQRLANVEEIVTAIQGIANLDNRGRTLWFTNFKDGIGDWEVGTGGDGSAPVSSTDEALVAPNSMKLDTGTDSGGGDSWAQKRINVRNIKKAGFEVSFQYRTIMGRLDIGLGYNKAARWYHGTVRIDRVAKAIQVWDNLTPTTIVTLPSAPLAGEWITIKLVIDFENEAYDRLLVGLTQYDISAYDLYNTAAVDEGFLRAQLDCDALGDGNNYIYIGHAAITIDEP